MHIWSDLNPHEQLILRAIYTTDQGQSRREKREASKTFDNMLPFSERGWLNYHPLPAQTESYLQTAIGQTLPADEITSTFEALKTYGLIECKYTVSNELSILWVKMTPGGRKITFNTFTFK